MKQNDFSDIDEQIKHTVENAFNYIDFAGIKENINNVAESTVNEVMEQFNGVKSQIKDASSHFENYMVNVNASNKKKNEISKYISPKPVGKYKGTVMITLGTLGATCSAFAIAIGAIAIAVMKKVIGIGSMTVVCIFVALMVINIYVLLRGSNIRNRFKRFKIYSEYLEKNRYCTIKELGEAVLKKEKYVISDLKKMISLGMYREAHFDDEYKYFMLSDEIYNQYVGCIKAFNTKKENEEKRANNKELREVDAVLDFGNVYIEEIQKVNLAIGGVEMTEKLNKLEKIISEIFKYIQKNPQKIPEVKKLINHYLPMTLKLVKSYKELSEQSIQGTNIKKAKIEIEKSIDLINTAFEKLLDDLFEDVVLDISSDISVLETLFTQEGLTKDDFKK